MTRLARLAFLCLLGTAACVPAPEVETLVKQGGAAPKGAAQLAPAVPDQPSDAVAHAFARAYLDNLQPRSIADRVEYCGYFFVTGAGAIEATPPRRGTFATCDTPPPVPGTFASYHTHGAFGIDYDNEVPSVTDLMSDFDLGIDGYVSTPGGRVWHVDYGSRITRQICGLGCVFVDPGFRPVDEASIRASYDLRGLTRRSRGF